ncbi:MAG: TolC family protein [bacterium]
MSLPILPVLCTLWLLLPLPGTTGTAAARQQHPQAEQPGAGEPLDLAACVRLALEANPGWLARRAAVEATRAGITESRSARYPSLDLTGSASRTDAGQTAPSDRHDLRLSLRQTLYQGGRVDASIEAARAALDADQAGLEASRADLVLAVHRAWYGLARSERLVDAARQGREQSRLNLEVAEAGLETGLGTRPDVLRARVDVSAAELTLTRARNDLERARAGLNALLGRPAGSTIPILSEGSGEPPPEVPEWDELRRTALERRPELRRDRARTDLREAAVRIARGTYYPSVTADAGLSRGGMASMSPDQTWSAGVVAALPLFDGRARAAGVWAQEALLEQARYDEEETIQQIELEVWEALLAERESLRRLENARTLVEAAQENLEAAQESYRQGLGSMVALVDARTALSEAEQILIETTYDRHVVRAVLERASGALVWEEERR